VRFSRRYILQRARDSIVDGLERVIKSFTAFSSGCNRISYTSRANGKDSQSEVRAASVCFYDLLKLK
jgi:hypothetical protein